MNEKLIYKKTAKINGMLTWAEVDMRIIKKQDDLTLSKGFPKSINSIRFVALYANTDH
jgi:hypothetical protein